MISTCYTSTRATHTVSVFSLILLTAGIHAVKDHYWINFHLEATTRRGEHRMKKRCSHSRTSLTFKLDLSEALNQRRQMVVAYAGLVFSP